MAVSVLYKWVKFNTITRHWKLYQEFYARTQLLTRQSFADPTQQEVVAVAPWRVQLWLVDGDCDFYDSALTTSDLPTSVHVPPYEHTTSIATL
jgi:hypothetical protein